MELTQDGIEATASLDGVKYDDETQMGTLQTNDKALAVALHGIIAFVDQDIYGSTGERDEIYFVEAKNIVRADFFGAVATAMLIREACNTAGVSV